MWSRERLDKAIEAVDRGAKLASQLLAFGRRQALQPVIVNLASTVPYHASQMYARNVSAFLLHLVKDGKLQLNLDDEIVRETLLTRDGEVVNPRIREFFSLPALPAESKEVAKS